MGSLGKGAWHETKRNYRLLSLKAQIEKLTRRDLRRAFHELGRKAADVTTPSELELRHVRDIEAKIGSLQAEYTRTAADQSAKMLVRKQWGPKIPAAEDAQAKPTIPPAETQDPINDADKKSSSLPRLWNPYLIVAYQMPFLGVWVGSAMVALNWHRLKRTRHAMVAWCFMILWTPLGLLAAETMSFMDVVLLSFVIWFPIVALPQIVYFRKCLQGGYEKRSLIIPIGIAALLGFTLVFLAAITSNQQEKVQRAATKTEAR